MQYEEAMAMAENNLARAEHAHNAEYKKGLAQVAFAYIELAKTRVTHG